MRDSHQVFFFNVTQKSFYGVKLINVDYKIMAVINLTIPLIQNIFQFTFQFCRDNLLSYKMTINKVIYFCILSL
jgi:hypothetical protein